MISNVQQTVLKISGAVQVIAISAAGGEQNVLDVAKLLGARRTLQKPFSTPRLLDAVRYELAHSRRLPSALSLTTSSPHWITHHKPGHL